MIANLHTILDLTRYETQRSFWHFASTLQSARADMNISRTLCFYLIQRRPGIELAVNSSIALKPERLSLSLSMMIFFLQHGGIF